MKTYRFSAQIHAVERGGACVYFPYDVEKEFGTRGRIPVKATFDGVAYTGTMIKYGAPQHMLPVLKDIRERIGKQPGDTIAVEVCRDQAERVLEVPQDLSARIQEVGLSETFQKLSYTHRKEYCRWITEAKRPETRTRRLEKALEMLRDGVKTPG